MAQTTFDYTATATNYWSEQDTRTTRCRRHGRIHLEDFFLWLVSGAFSASISPGSDLYCMGQIEGVDFAGCGSAVPPGVALRGPAKGISKTFPGGGGVTIGTLQEAIAIRGCRRRSESRSKGNTVVEITCHRPSIYFVWFHDPPRHLPLRTTSSPTTTLPNSRIRFLV